MTDRAEATDLVLKLKKALRIISRKRSNHQIHRCILEQVTFAYMRDICMQLWNITSDTAVRSFVVEEFNGIELMRDVIVSCDQSLKVCYDLLSNKRRRSYWMIGFRGINKVSRSDVQTIMEVLEWCSFFACGVMCNLTYDHDDDRILDMIIRLDYLVPSILKIMGASVDKLEVQCRGCWMLFCLAHEIEGGKRLIQLGADRIIIQAMKRYPDTNIIQQEATGCLWCLAESFGSTLTVLRMIEWSFYVLQSVCLLDENELVARNSAGCIAHLTRLGGQTVVNTMLGQGCCEIMAGVYDRFKENEEICRYTSQVILNVSQATTPHVNFRPNKQLSPSPVLSIMFDYDSKRRRMPRRSHV